MNTWEVFLLEGSAEATPFHISAGNLKKGSGSQWARKKFGTVFPAPVWFLDSPNTGRPLCGRPSFVKREQYCPGVFPGLLDGWADGEVVWSVRLELESSSFSEALLQSVAHGELGKGDFSGVNEKIDDLFGGRSLVDQLTSQSIEIRS